MKKKIQSLINDYKSELDDICGEIRDREIKKETIEEMIENLEDISSKKKSTIHF